MACSVFGFLSRQYLGALCDSSRLVEALETNEGLGLAAGAEGHKRFLGVYFGFRVQGAMALKGVN